MVLSLSFSLGQFDWLTWREKIWLPIPLARPEVELRVFQEKEAEKTTLHLGNSEKTAGRPLQYFRGCIHFLRQLWQITTNLMAYNSRNLFSHRSGGQKFKTTVSEHSYSEVSRGAVPRLFQLLLVSGVPWPRWRPATLLASASIFTSPLCVRVFSSVKYPMCLLWDTYHWIQSPPR